MTNFLSTQPYKGTRDFYPDDMAKREWVFGKMKTVAQSYGFQEYDGPSLEPFELYSAKTGDEIVNQQLYWLVDKGERKLAVRPEMTPTLARMVAGKLQDLPKPIRWFSIPNLWRYERPQRGRLREHWQLNVDILGGEPLLADAEILTLALSLMKSFGGEKFVEIRVNHRGLMDHLFKQIGLETVTAHKTAKLLDARGKIGEEVFLKCLSDLGLSQTQVQVMNDILKSSFAEIEKKYPCQAVSDLKVLFQVLDEAGIMDHIIYDPKILRGLDYYTGTVFEMYDKSPENSRAMFGGGRYDNLIGLFGKNQLSGVGFGMGDVTMQNFLEIHGLMPILDSGVDVYVCLPDMNTLGIAQKLAAELREGGFRVVNALKPGGMGEHLKTAVKLGAKTAILFGEAELKKGNALVKNLKTEKQTELKLDKILENLNQILEK